MASKPAFFEALLKSSRKLEWEYEAATANASANSERVRSIVASFLGDYADFNQIQPAAALASYTDFNDQYVRDIRAFTTTGKYPLEIEPQPRKIGRSDYDIALILSILVLPHRCAIMEQIMNTDISGRPLVIGVGSGVELSFVQSLEGGDAYDLYINPFARTAFSRWKFHEEWYRPSDHLYETVVAIELLEHLPDPYAFVAACYVSLKPGGRFVATTASNVPQFDHCYNFVSDEDFERRVVELGFELESKCLIPHEYPLMNIRANNAGGARNVFYVFRRKGA